MQLKLEIRRLLKSIKAFTLVELMVVISVISVIATICTKSYRQYIINTQADSIAQQIKLIAGAINYYFYDNGKYPGEYPGEPFAVDVRGNVESVIGELISPYLPSGFSYNIVFNDNIIPLRYYYHKGYSDLNIHFDTRLINGGMALPSELILAIAKRIPARQGNYINGQTVMFEHLANKMYTFHLCDPYPTISPYYPPQSSLKAPAVYDAWLNST